MLRVPFVMGICLGLALPVLADAQAPGASPSADPSRQQVSPPSPASEDDQPMCEPDAEVQEPDDPRWRWRLRAYRHLDCVVSLVDAALDGQPPARGGKEARAANEEVVISR